MEPSTFRSLVNNFTTLTPAEYTDISSLVQENPYSQILHVLAARAAKDLNSADQQEQLHRAAVYATDRSVVKWAMSAPVKARVSPAASIVVPPEVKQEHTRLANPKPAIPLAGSAPAAIPLEGDALREDLSKELKRLQTLKHDFEVSYESLKHSLHPASTPVTEPSIGAEPPLIEEIKATRKKLKVPSPKVAEQGEIIDQFIKVAPTLPKGKVVESSVDLAKDSVNYSDNIVSETLVNILVKQGKKVKAIEMLKKLIWKFPQKKAYFAAQIEDLKN